MRCDMKRIDISNAFNETNMFTSLFIFTRHGAWIQPSLYEQRLIID